MEVTMTPRSVSRTDKMPSGVYCLCRLCNSGPSSRRDAKRRLARFIRRRNRLACRAQSTT